MHKGTFTVMVNVWRESGPWESAEVFILSSWRGLLIYRTSCTNYLPRKVRNRREIYFSSWADEKVHFPSYPPFTLIHTRGRKQTRRSRAICGAFVLFALYWENQKDAPWKFVRLFVGEKTSMLIQCITHGDVNNKSPRATTRRLHVENRPVRATTRADDVPASCPAGPLPVRFKNPTCPNH